MSLLKGPMGTKCTKLCVQCLEFLDTSTFVDAASRPDLLGTATVNIVKTLKRVADTTDECEICNVILSNAQEFANESPEIKVEFVFGTELYDIMRIRLIHQGRTSGNPEFDTGFDQVLRSFMVYALPGRSLLRSSNQEI